MQLMHTICYLGSIMIFGAYCVDKVHNMLPSFFYDNESILCRIGTQYACYLGSIMKMEYLRI